MKDLINTVFGVVATLFDKIPGLSKLKGYRSVLGFVGLAVVYGMRTTGHGSPELLTYLETGFMALTGLSLLAHGTE